MFINTRIAAAFASAALLAFSAATYGDTLINEILVDNFGIDDDREYVEFLNTDGAGSADGLWLLQINGNASAPGNIDASWDLSGLSFGSNGLLTVGNNYDVVPLGGPWSNIVDAATAFGDPTGFDDKDLKNSTYTWLLVTNFNPAITNDLDANNDGVIDTTPWDAILDGVGWLDTTGSDFVYSSASLEQNSTPDAATRIRGNTDASSFAAWVNGGITAVVPDTLGLTYSDINKSDNMPADSTLSPGALNLSFSGVSITNPAGTIRVAEAVIEYTIEGTISGSTSGDLTWTNSAGGSGTLPVSANWSFTPLLSLGDNLITVSATNDFGDSANDMVTITRLGRMLINEILVNAVGVDDSREFVELRHTGGAAVISNMWLLQVSGDMTSLGEIDERWDLDGFSFGANGLLLIGNNYDDLPVGGPWSNIVDAATAFADPVGLSGGSLNNGSLTWLLVEGDQPLVSDIDTNDNGIIDTASWTVLHDSVGWTTGDTNDACYSDACLTQSSGTPDGASRFPDNDLANHVWAWFNADVTTNQTDDTLGRTYDATAASAELPADARLTPGGDADPITGWDGIIYIDPNRGGGGTSWSQAYTDLVDALAGSRISDAAFLNKIWIAQGNAIVEETAVITNDNLIVYGGFTNGMTSSSQRDPGIHISGLDGLDSIRVIWVKSSDVTLDGLTIQNGTVANDEAGGGILFMGDASTANITLTNCVIKGCLGGGLNPGSFGAGFAAFGQGSFDPGLVRIDNCIFDSNRGGQHNSPNGAGAYVIRADTVQITDCVFTNNGGGGGQGFFSGGGLYAENIVSLTIQDTLFVRNNGDSKYGDLGYGGAIFIKSPGTYSGGGFPLAIGDAPFELAVTYETDITRCVFDSNFMKADSYGTGSGIAAVGENTSVTIENSAFMGNGLGGDESTSRGGAMFVDNLAGVTINHCVLLGNGLTFNGSNSEAGGGAIHAKGGSTVLLKNCVLDDNSANTGVRTLMQQETAAITLDHCWLDGVSTNEVTAGVTIAAGVLAGSDPLFASVVSNDFQLASGSPCIDAGDNNLGLATDYVGIPRPLDGDTNGTAIVDMGMFERVEEDADSDGDTLSDGFEINTSGTSPVLADTDSDGANDFQEVGADTDPLDPNAFLAITSVTNSPETVVGFESSAARTYGLLRTDNLATGMWSTVDGLIVPGTGGSLFLSDTNTYAGPQYYRIGVSDL